MATFILQIAFKQKIKYPSLHVKVTQVCWLFNIWQELNPQLRYLVSKWVMHDNAKYDTWVEQDYDHYSFKLNGFYDALKN